MSPSTRTYNQEASQRLTTQLVGLPPHQSLGVLAHFALKALVLLQQQQLALPLARQEPLWYVEGTIAFPQLRVAWDSAWVERGDTERIDVLRPLLEPTTYIYFPAARYVVTQRLDPGELEQVRLPLVRELEAHPGTYPKCYYQEAHDWAVMRAVAASEDQYFQARASSLAREVLLKALTTQDQRLLSYLPTSQAPLVQTLRADPVWVGKNLSWAIDR